MFKQVLIEAKRYAAVKVVENVRTGAFDFIFYDLVPGGSSTVVTVSWQDLEGVSPVVADWLATLTQLNNDVTMHLRKLEFMVKQAKIEEEK